MFLVVYVALAVSFAIFDWWLARDQYEQHYYAPYAKFEPTTLRDTQQVEVNLQQAILHNLKENQTSGTGWRVEQGSLNVYHLGAPRDGIVTFTMYVMAQLYKNDTVIEGIGGPFEVTVDMKRIAFASPAPTVCHFVTEPQVPKSTAPADFDFGILFDVHRPFNMSSSICWSNEEDQKLARLLIGWKGNPRTLSGFFERMLYFSVTTITTVGFGDILPLSGTARGSAGLEAIAGWLVAGLFLNAIAWRAGRAASDIKEPNEPPKP
jgi:hypothetical protein